MSGTNRFAVDLVISRTGSVKEGRSLECTHGPVRSEDAVPFPHPETQRVSLALLPFDPHLARAYQFPAIHPESSRLRPQILLPVW